MYGKTADSNNIEVSDNSVHLRINIKKRKWFEKIKNKEDNLVDQLSLDCNATNF